MQHELKILLDREAKLRRDEADTLAKQAQLARQRAEVVGAIAETKGDQAKFSEGAGEASRLLLEARHHKEQRRIVLHEARVLDSEAARARTEAETARHKSAASTNGDVELKATAPKGLRRSGTRRAPTKNGSRPRSI